MSFSIPHLISLVRPHQYIKNLFIFTPMFFVGKISEMEILLQAVIAFIAFCFCASGIYILNDLQDIESDQLHPKKKHRPLATGAIEKKMALALMGCLFALGFTGMGFLSVQALAFLGAYVVLNIAYSFYIKHIAILDVFTIAIGFVLRLYVGSDVTGVPLSMWIVIMTFLLALFMALAKRRDDVLLYLDTGQKMRKVIDGYTLQLIDGAMLIMASVVIVSYLLYATSAEVVLRLGNDHLYLTTAFVILGIMRYLQITFVLKDSGSPTKIVLKDRFMQLTISAWVCAFGWIIYS